MHVPTLITCRYLYESQRKAFHVWIELASFIDFVGLNMGGSRVQTSLKSIGQIAMVHVTYF